MPLIETIRGREVVIREIAEPDPDVDPLEGFHMERYEAIRSGNASWTRVHGREVLAPTIEEALLREIKRAEEQPQPTVRTPRSPAMRRRLGLE